MHLGGTTGETDGARYYTADISLAREIEEQEKEGTGREEEAEGNRKTRY